MALIHCPQCGQTVLSVASVCPRCSFLLTQKRFQQNQDGALTACRRCGSKVWSGTTECPQCGLKRPGRHPALIWAAAAGTVAAIALLTVGVQAVTTDRSADPVAVATEAAAQPTLPLPPPVAPVIRAAAPARASVAAPATGAFAIRWASTWANVREQPARDAAVVRILTPGEEVRVGQRQEGWRPVILEGRQIGFVANSLLANEPPETDQ